MNKFEQESAALLAACRSRKEVRMRQITMKEHIAMVALQGKLPAGEVAKVFDVSERTVYRFWNTAYIQQLRAIEKEDRARKKPPDAELFKDGLYYKIARGRVWRWSDIEQDWVLANRPAEEL